MKQAKRRVVGQRSFVPLGFVAGGLLLAGAPLAWSQDEDWAPTLASDSTREFRKSDEAITIELPELPDGALETLAVELDANDVSSLVEVSEDGRQLVLKSEVPLAPGPHNLRLVQVDEAGNLIERGNWEFEVRQSSLFRSTQLTYAFGLNGSQRVHSRKESETPDELEGTGSGKFGYMTDTGSHVNRAKADLLYDSNWNQTGAPRPIELGDFLLTSEGDNSRFSAGHHFPGPVVGSAGSSLVMDGGSRRGVSGSWGIRRWPTNFSAFVLRTDSIYGFQKGLGIGDSENRIEGLMFDTLVYSSGESRVKFGLGHVTGAGEQGGTAIGDPADGNQFLDPGMAGDASNLTLEGIFAEGQVTSRLELAQTSRDIGFGIPDVDDDGYTFLLGYRPKRALVLGGREMTWGTSFNHQKIGSFFRSIASPGGGVDVYMSSLNADAQLGEFDSTLSIVRTEDNVNDLDLQTTRLESHDLTFGYAPELEPEQLPSWLQSPSLSLGFNKSTQKTVDEPMINFADPTDNETTTSNLSLDFTHPYGSWGLSFNPTRFKDHTGLLSNERTRTFSIDSSFSFADGRYTLMPSVSWDRIKDETTGITTKTRDLTVNQTFVLIPKVLTGGLNLTQNLNALSDDSVDSKMRSASLNMNWNVQRIPGLGISLLASYNDTRDRAPPDPLFGPQDFFAVPDNKDHQVFMSFSYTFAGAR